jgi:dipeptidyl aminopeptidase/acylaminoacyl peptidase
MGRLALILVFLTAPSAVAGPCGSDGDGLPEGALARLGRPANDADSVHAVAFAPDGQTVALAQGRRLLLETLDGRNVRELSGHATPIMHLAFAPRGVLATASTVGDPQPVRIWDVATGSETRQWGDATRTVRGLAFTPDGQTLAILEPEAVTLHCLSRGRFAGALPAAAEPGDYDRIAVSPDGRLLAAGGRGGRRVIWDLESRQLSHAGFGGRACRGLSFFPYGERLLWLDASQLTLWHARGDGPPAPDFASAWAPGANTLALARDGRTFAIAFGSVVELWDVLARRPMRQLRGHGATLRGIAFSPDGRTLVSGSDDGTAIVWDATGLAGVPAGSLPAAWEDLANADPLIARRATWQLTAAPGGVTMISDRAAALRDTLKRVEQLLADLDDDRFSVRRQATSELARLGDMVAPRLQKALGERLTPEARGRVERLLNECTPVGGDGTELSAERRRWLRCVEVLEHRADGDARALLTTLTSLPSAAVADGARAALKRLVANSAERSISQKSN